jgi:sialate O-acetylesterase
MFTVVPLLAALVLSGGLIDSQVLQREGNDTASAILKGNADSAGRLSVQVNDGSWTDAGALPAGPWEAELPTLTTGGPYQLRLRFTGASGAASEEKTIHDIYVGDLWVLAGQSNMVGRTRIDPSYTKDARVRMLSVEGVWQQAAHPLHEPNRPGAGPGIAFGVAMVQSTKVPVGLIPCAKGGTSMDQWSPAHAHQGTASLYGNLLTRVRSVGGRVAGVVWYQGENDTGTKPSALYREKFQQLISKLRGDLNAPILPFYYAQLARYVNYVTNPSTHYGEWNVVQEAQRLIEQEVPAVRMIATLDLEQGDLIHLNRESLERVGRRFALAAQGKGGPRIVAARWTSRQEIRLTISGANGRLVVPGGRVFGFQTTVGNKPGPALYQATIEPETNEVVLKCNRDSADRSAGDNIDLWYGRGLDPICNVVDSADLALPMSGPIRLPVRPPLPPSTK